MEKLYTSEYCSYYFDINTKMISVVWTSKPMTNDQFKSHLTILGEKAAHYRPTLLFVDARLHKHTISSEIQHWHDEIIVPIYLKAGIKRMAFLNPESIFTEVTTKKVFQLSNAKQTLLTEFFKSEKEAKEWLIS